MTGDGEPPWTAGQSTALYEELTSAATRTDEVSDMLDMMSMLRVINDDHVKLDSEPGAPPWDFWSLRGLLVPPQLPCPVPPHRHFRRRRRDHSAAPPQTMLDSGDLLAKLVLTIRRLLAGSAAVSPAHPPALTCQRSAPAILN